MPTPAKTAPPVATSLDSSAESATIALYRAAIGPISNDYYLPIFARFEVADRAGLSWNWAASLYTLNWMLFRHLWTAAGVYVAALAGAVVIAVVGGVLFQLSELAEWGLWLALVVLSFVVPGVYGNAWLHTASRKKMAAALSASGTLREACAMLNRQASSRQRFIWQAGVNLVLAGAVAGAYVAFLPAGSLPFTPNNPAKAQNLTVGQLTGVPPPAAPLPAPALSAAPVAVSVASPVTAPAPAVSVALVPAGVASASIASPIVVSSAPLSPVPAQATQEYLDAMAVATSRYVPRRPAAPDAGPEAAPAPLQVAQAGAPLTKARPEATAPAPKSVQASAAPASKTSASTVNDKKNTKATTTTAVTKPYTINVGLFANEANASKAHARLRGAGLAASMQELDTASGHRTRVRVGPFSTRAEANAAVKKIHALKLDAVVVQP